MHDVRVVTAAPLRPYLEVGESMVMIAVVQFRLLFSKTKLSCYWVDFS